MNILLLVCLSVPGDDASELRKTVEALASESMRGRKAGTEGERRARRYLVQRFKAARLSPLSGSHVQKFLVSRGSSETQSANVLGWIDNHAPSTVMIGAHYDHLGLGGPKSRSLTSKRVHPGADDNASGVAMLLLLAKRLRRDGPRKFNYLFIAFSAHEEGLYGAAEFVRSKLYDPAKIRLMFNFDMVGRLNRTTPILRVTRRSVDKKLDPVLKQAKDRAFGLRIVDQGLKDTDGGAFAAAGISVLSITTGAHEDYHKTSDTPDKVNYVGMVAVADFVGRLLVRFEQEPK